MTYNFLEIRLAKLENRHKEALRGIRCALTDRKIRSTDEMKPGLRRRFFNVKAIELMMMNGIDHWTNGKCEEEIIEQCHSHGLEPDLNQWDEEWNDYAKACESLKAERIRKIEEDRINALKMQHMIQIKKMKIEALLSTIKFDDAVSVSVDKNFEYKPERINRGGYMLHFMIAEARIVLEIKYNQVDSCLPKILELLKKANALVPDLMNAFEKDNENKEYPHLPSYKLVNSINDIFNELQDYLIKNRE